MVGLVAKLVGPEGTATAFWMHTDRLGSIQAVTNGAGSEVLRRSYEAFGDRTFDSSSHPETRGYIEQREDETGLVYLHARYYEPSVGLFISPDPLHPDVPGVRMNRYAYALGDPVNGKDPSGLLVYSCMTSVRFGDPVYECEYSYDFGFGGVQDPRGDQRGRNDTISQNPGCPPPLVCGEEPPPSTGDQRATQPTTNSGTTTTTGRRPVRNDGTGMQNYRVVFYPSSDCNASPQPCLLSDQWGAGLVSGVIGAELAAGAGAAVGVSGAAGAFFLGGAGIYLAFERTFAGVSGNYQVIYEPRPEPPPMEKWE
jgi:RHS repeat-associated protein